MCIGCNGAAALSVCSAFLASRLRECAISPDSAIGTIGRREKSDTPYEIRNSWRFAVSAFVLGFRSSLDGVGLRCIGQKTRKPATAKPPATATPPRSVRRGASMKAVDRPFTKIINGTTQFVIPIFQRDYRWSETRCEHLWRDILLIARDKSVSVTHNTADFQRIPGLRLDDWLTP
jgi:hypothetical protein